MERFLFRSSELNGAAKRPDTARRPAAAVGAASRVDAEYHVPIGLLSEAELDRYKALLTMQAKDSGFGKPDAFPAFRASDTTLSVPRHYGQTEFGQAGEDCTAEGEEIAFRFEGALNDKQVQALAGVEAEMEGPLHAKGCLLVLPCGYGKTVAALRWIADRGRRALVLVGKAFLQEQWKAQAGRFLPSASVGLIRGDTFEVADVTIGMVQSLCARTYDPAQMRRFGTVVVDEAHHMAARWFSTALLGLPARRRLALSATPERSDGLTRLLHYSMGRVGFKAERSAANEAVRVERVLYEGWAAKLGEAKGRDGKVALASMVTRLCADAGRTATVCSKIAEAHREGRCVIVLSGRVDHLLRVEEGLNRLFASQRGEGQGREEGQQERKAEIGWYVGKTSRAERRKTEEKSTIVLATYAMATEGLDMPRMDTLFLITPVSGESAIEQCIGRIQRPDPSKQPPLVVDFVDPYSIFFGMAKKRERFYAKSKYRVESAPS